ncbi:MAG: twin-arginine translocase TatA/TatE family subunit [Microcella sp.]|uniref:twin-arginine translocase TatA/TatE family subunit n=1 Tax=Microcella sp. TaxID=1913979 RepID=UPI00331535A7
MPANLGGWTGLILLLVVILLFAAPKLPQLARSLGQSMTIFKKEIKNKDGEPAADASGDAASTRQDSTGSGEGSDSSNTK